ncbi:MAG: YkgJ family cysteine cluster protein [Deltaproteobacteria bacterium]|nr:YkgJ family cysteine cluster protein [Deltaproteobacteria bacterium]
MSNTGKIEKAQTEFLKDRPRLGLDDEFRFDCRPGISCFNVCCGDVTIVLSPYDVLRLKNRLQISSFDVLSRYTFIPTGKEQPFPVVFLKMGEDENKKCPFVSDKGCTVYADRPWPCRMYPIGHASNRTAEQPLGEDFYFLVEEGHCKGHDQDRTWTVRKWLEDQRTEEYDRMGEFFRDLTLHANFIEKHQVLNAAQRDMFIMAMYDLDRFRRFLFESTFLDRFFVDPERVEHMKKDDEDLLEFGFLWLRYALFGEKTMKLKPEAAKAAREAVELTDKVVPKDTVEPKER